MKITISLAVLAFAALNPMPGNAHAAGSHAQCKYISRLHALIADLNKLVNRMPNLTHQQAYDQGLTLLIREGHFMRKPNVLPLDLRQAFGATVKNLQEGTRVRTRGTTDQYNHYVNQAHRSMGATWTAYRKHYGNTGCTGA